MYVDLLILLKIILLFLLILFIRKQSHPMTREMIIIEMPKGEEEEQEIENLFEKIIKENFPNLVKEIDIQV